MIVKALRRGVRRTVATGRLIGVLYIAELLCALVLTLPLWAILDRFGGWMAGGLDVNFFIELHAYHDAELGGLAKPRQLIVVGYVLACLFFSGGALAVLAGGERCQPSVFWGQAAKFFGRFLRLAVWSLLVLLSVSLAPLAAYGLQKLVYGSDPYEKVLFWGFWLQVGLAVAGLFVYRIVLDYARIHTVLADEKRMRVSLWKGVRFTVGNPGRTLGLAFLLLFAGGVAIALYRPLAGALGAPTSTMVVLLFLLQQLYIIWRMAFRVTRYASQLELYRYNGRNGWGDFCP